jgi:hypothetical protein
MEQGLKIDFDTANKITLTCLTEQRKYLKKELKEYKKGKYLHPDDVVRNKVIIATLDILIPYYGGSND